MHTWVQGHKEVIREIKEQQKLTFLDIVYASLCSVCTLLCTLQYIRKVNSHTCLRETGQISVNISSRDPGRRRKSVRNAEN
jgi:hypothetical protein